VRVRYHGLRVAPKRTVSAQGRIPYCGRVVVPTMTNRAMTRATKSPSKLAPNVSRLPATARLFLIAVRTPANGRGSPGAMATASASASAAKASTNALTCGLSALMRSSEVCTSSRAESSPQRTASGERGDRTEEQLGGVGRGHSSHPFSSVTGSSLP